MVKHIGLIGIDLLQMEINPMPSKPKPAVEPKENKCQIVTNYVCGGNSETCNFYWPRLCDDGNERCKSYFGVGICKSELARDAAREKTKKER